MRIVAWNASMALGRKFAFVEALRPDLAVVSECAEAFPVPAGVSSVWVGRNRHKGLGVFGFGDYSVTLDELYDERMQWVAPVHVEGPVRMGLLGVWAQGNRGTDLHPLEPRHSQPQQGLALYGERFTGVPLIAAGDFNDNVTWDKPGGHAANWDTTVERYAEAGLVSAYHRFYDEPYGAETRPTIYWRDRKLDGPRYHIDFCFVPETWTIDNVEIGSFEDWVAIGLSDHVPVIVDVTP